MIRKPCPERYEAHSDACYFFGGHASFEAAQSHCKSVGARLVDVDPRNNKYLKEQLTKHGGNDNWIGSYVVRGKISKRKGSNCPMIKGQSTRSGTFSLVNCNSAYPYICQYGDTQYVNKVNGIDRFDPLGGEQELPVTVAGKLDETTTAVKESSDSAVIASVVAVGVFLIIAIIMRYICNRRRKKAEKDKMKELQKTVSTVSAVPKTGSRFPNSSFNGLSRTTTINKPFSLPGVPTDASTFTRRTSEQNIHRKRKGQQEDMSRGRHNRRSSKSIETEQESRRFNHRSHRSKSRERHLHGRHSPPPPYGQLYRGSSTMSTRRRHSMSRIESMTEAATTYYSDLSRSSSSDSRISDSSMSKMTETTCRRSHRLREGRHRQQHDSRRYRRESPRSQFYDDRNEDDYRSGDDRRGRQRSHHQCTTMFEEYAHARPPSPALDIMARQNIGADFNDRSLYHRRSLTLHGGDRRYNANLTHCQLPDQPGLAMYFPQMTTAWAAEDFRYAENANNLQTQVQPKSYPPHQARFPHHGPIRVNRHIHDIEVESTKSKQQSPEEDSDHIYESLDEVNDPQNNEIQAVPLHIHRPQMKQGSAFTRDMNRASGRSRASVRSRGPPVTAQP